jgi:hypothetical protein
VLASAVETLVAGPEITGKLSALLTFSLRWEEELMPQRNPVELLLVEDNPNDLELALHARKHNHLERTRSIPVEMLTSTCEGRDGVENDQLGVNSDIVRPVDFEPFTVGRRGLGMYGLLLNQPPKLGM